MEIILVGGPLDSQLFEIEQLVSVVEVNYQGEVVKYCFGGTPSGEALPFIWDFSQIREAFPGLAEQQRKIRRTENEIGEIEHAAEEAAERVRQDHQLNAVRDRLRSEQLAFTDSAYRVVLNDRRVRVIRGSSRFAGVMRGRGLISIDTKDLSGQEGVIKSIGAWPSHTGQVGMALEVAIEDRSYFIDPTQCELEIGEHVTGPYSDLGTVKITRE